jgi:hypothetical protein
MAKKAKELFSSMLLDTPKEQCFTLRFPGFAPFTDKSRIETKISMEDWWID